MHLKLIKPSLMRPEIHCRPPPSDISFQIVPYFDEQSSRRTTDFSSSNIYSSGCVQLKFEASEGRKLKVLYLVVFRRLQRSFCPGSCMICFYEVPCSPLNQAWTSAHEVFSQEWYSGSASGIFNWGSRRCWTSPD